MTVLRRLARALTKPQPAPPPLGCGCPGTTNVVYSCVWCNHTHCVEHRDQPHDCPHPRFEPRRRSPLWTPGGPR